MRALRFCLLQLGLLSAAAAAAQRLAPGYIVLVSGDSIRGAIRLSTPIEQQLEVKFVPLSASQLLKLPPSRLRAYGYVHGSDTVRYVACPVQLGYPVACRPGPPAAGSAVNIVNDTTWLLLKQVLAGPVQLYERYDSRYEGRSSSQSLRQYCLRKGRAVPVNTYWWNFPKDAAAFFHDNPALTAKLRTRRYHARDLKTVVRLYNCWQLAALQTAVP